MGFRRMLGSFTGWMNTADSALQRMDATLQTHLDGGVEHIHLRCWIIQLYITGKFRPMMLTAAQLKCMATNAHYRLTLRLLRIL